MDASASSSSPSLSAVEKAHAWAALLLDVELAPLHPPLTQGALATPKTAARLAHHLAIGGHSRGTTQSAIASRRSRISGPLKAVVLLGKASRQQGRYFVACGSTDPNVFPLHFGPASGIS